MEDGGFTEADIKAALEDLISAKGYGKYKFCLFIDRLDEYLGDGTKIEEMAREKMAEMLTTWAAGKILDLHQLPAKP
jgi:hypothetical protein